jgi:hypothetical protein
LWYVRACRSGRSRFERRNWWASSGVCFAALYMFSVSSFAFWELDRSLLLLSALAIGGRCVSGFLLGAGTFAGGISHVVCGCYLLGVSLGLPELNPLRIMLEFIFFCWFW